VLDDLPGDFVVAAWDAVERCLWLARDAIGFRPLFYFQEHHDVWFSNELRWLTAGPANKRGIHGGHLPELTARVPVGGGDYTSVSAETDGRRGW